MERGLNSDIIVEGTPLHVQTEDWGESNPFVVSRVYRDGRVLKTYKTSYNEFLGQGPASYQEAIRLALKEQHLKILDLLLSGQLPS